MIRAFRKQKQKETLFKIANDVLKELGGLITTNIEQNAHHDIISTTLDKLLAKTGSSAAYVYEVVPEESDREKMVLFASRSNNTHISTAQIETLLLKIVGRTPTPLCVDPEWACSHATRECASLMALPLVYNRKVIGALILASLHQRFRQGDVRLFQPVVASLSAFMGNLQKEKNWIRTEKRMRELHQALNQFKFALHSTSIVSITDAQGTIKYANKKFSEISKYTHQELIGRKHNIINSGHFPRDFWKNMWGTISKGEIWRSEIKNKAKDGAFYWVDTFIVPLKDTTGKVIEFMSIRYDITERKKYEDKLNALSIVAREAWRKAEESDRLKSAFIANMSHEIRTPMNAIMGISELLEKDSLSESKKKQYTRLIRERSGDLLGIVDNVLDMARIESGSVYATEQCGNIRSFLDEVLISFGAEVRRWKKNIVVEMHCDLEKDGENIMADFVHLREVLDNLLSNALKFTDGSGLIKFGCTRLDEKTLRFTVRDSGRGIAPEKQQVIFKPFRQADVTTHQYYGGTGLGLAIAKGYVELWGGKIDVQSDETGSLFFFTMPYKITSGS